MKALRLVTITPQLLLEEVEMPLPEPQPGEVLVRVRATGVMPTEPFWDPTLHTKDGGPRNAPVLSHEFSGEIAACGDGVDGLAVGQEVYGMNDWYADGALAEYCVTKPDWIANKPRSLSHEEAASVPISALTARQALFQHGRLQPAERVLIHGGAGAVGMFAVQLAHSHGAWVATTVSASDVDFVKSLGADESVDYRATAFEQRGRDLDLVFDTVGGDTLRRSWQILKPGGRLVTIASTSESETDQRVRQSFFIVEPNRTQLVEVGNLLDTGKLRTAVGAVVPISRATDAYLGSFEKTKRGKLVVSTREWTNDIR